MSICLVVCKSVCLSACPIPQFIHSLHFSPLASSRPVVLPCLSINFLLSNSVLASVSSCPSFRPANRPFAFLRQPGMTQKLNLARMRSHSARQDEIQRVAEPASQMLSNDTVKNGFPGFVIRCSVISLPQTGYNKPSNYYVM